MCLPDLRRNDDSGSRRPTDARWKRYLAGFIGRRLPYLHDAGHINPVQPATPGWRRSLETHPPAPNATAWARSRVPARALWRAQTQRALEDFPISGQHSSLRHHRDGPRQAGCGNGQRRPRDHLGGSGARHHGAPTQDHPRAHHAIPLDVSQTGSGTSSSMNVDEVLASLAERTGVRFTQRPVSASQSSNDAFPTSRRMAAVEAVTAG